MIENSELSNVSQITENIYLSGIFPLDENHHIIKNLGIKFILSCVDRMYISETHNKIMTDNPDLTILYLPYNDLIDQNLWEKNKDTINIFKYTKNLKDFDDLKNQIQMYNNKSMIEIGYHFINDAISKKNKVLVHCMAGISRSVSLVIYYFMKKYFWSYEQAIYVVKYKRTIANPNCSFKNQLRLYQTKRDKFTREDANEIIKNAAVSYKV